MAILVSDNFAEDNCTLQIGTSWRDWHEPWIEKPEPVMPVGERGRFLRWFNEENGESRLHLKEEMWRVWKGCVASRMTPIGKNPTL